MEFRHDPAMGKTLRHQVVALWLDVAATKPPGLPPQVRTGAARRRAECMLDSAERGTARLLVGTEAEHLRAVCFLVPNTSPVMAHWCMLTAVMVHPSCQRRGLGRRLVSHALEWAQEMGYEAVYLIARADRWLEAFYASCGFREVGRSPGAIREHDHRIHDLVHLWCGLGIAQPTHDSGQ